MCVVSMVMDHFIDKWQPPLPQINIPTVIIPMPAMPTQAEVDEFHRLLSRARKYDAEHNEPDCELAEKKALLKKIADALGVKLELEASP